MTVLHYLEKTVQKFPDKTAIVDSNGSISFAELRDRAVSLAGCIADKLNNKTRMPILVYLPKSKESIISFMGILYSGNIYTPTNVRFPFPKVQGIIDVLSPALYISDEKHAKQLYDNGIPDEHVIILENITASAFDINQTLLKMIDTDPVDILFTSGSTGKPKGVTICHRSIMDYIDWAAECYDISENEIIGNQAPFYFDNSMLDIYLCLKTGAQMNIIPENLFAFPARLVEYLDENNINFIFWVPSVICHIANLDALEDIKPSNLRKILFAGEVMPNKQLNYWRSHLPDALYSNLYGPTEITVDCTYYIVDREFDDDEPLPIGVICENSDVLLLDENNNQITEQDIQGEICVRGSSLAHGYWNNPEKTAAAFCQNPLNPHYPERIYRTGDLAHYNDRGEIMFDGRKDFQIKHLGNRIELGEIEAAAASLDEVKIVSSDYDMIKQEIVLFYLGDLEDKHLQVALLKLLPKYMVPTRYIKLDEFPYNDNSKIDRIKLRKEHIEV